MIMRVWYFFVPNPHDHLSPGADSWGLDEVGDLVERPAFPDLRAHPRVAADHRVTLPSPTSPPSTAIHRRSAMSRRSHACQLPVVTCSAREPKQTFGSGYLKTSYVEYEI